MIDKKCLFSQQNKSEIIESQNGQNIKCTSTTVSINKYNLNKLGLAGERTDKSATIGVNKEVAALSFGCGAVDGANTDHGGDA